MSERAVLTDPAAVSGHLALCGEPTSAFQPLRCCRPAGKYLTRLNRFTFVTARPSLCLRLVWFVTSSDPRLDSRWGGCTSCRGGNFTRWRHQVYPGAPWCRNRLA